MRRVFLALAVCLLGLGAFYLGFFLTRIELRNQSQCSTNGDGMCNFKAKYDKCILVVIDALRLDFVLPNELKFLRETNPNPVYLNKLVTLRELLDSEPNHTFISRFDADPPTTTMQRLKGLTVGGLPTFIDIKDDVASEAISEDNILLQLHQQKKRVTFMGDDTWVKLFPHEFTKQFPFDSFNVKDLDTLDNGVIANLMPQIRRGDWDLLIAHFLGVDHAGHRYGPNHSEMTRKLIQMDNVLEALIREMPQDALLLVIGDHGMTEDGNHGGASLEERSTAIFAYSPGRQLDPTRRVDMVQQVDLAATLALLLDFPIPFGNLGFFIPGLLGEHHGNEQELLEMARVNAQQILTYFDTYPTEIVPLTLLQELRELLSRNGDGDGGVLFQQLQSTCRLVVDAARLQWTQFDLPLMVGGMGLGAAGMGALMWQSRTQLHYPSLLVWLLSLLALTSNSYINAEAQVSVFCLQTLLLATGKLSKQTVAQLLLVRLAIPLGEVTRANGHEVLAPWHLIQACAGAAVLLLWTTTNKIVALQLVCGLGFYFGTVLDWVEQHQANLLAQTVFLMLFPVGIWFAHSVNELLLVGIVPLSLIIGPTSGFPVIFGFWYLSQTETEQNGVWYGVRLALVAEVAFFASGHLCDFGALRITSPYVGFELFNYYRGVVMLSIDTFGAHLIGLGLARAAAGRLGVQGFLLVFASRSLVTMWFVCFARRHLMVWAIFAPKFIFDAAGMLACCVFALLLELLCARFASPTGGSEEEAKLQGKRL
ncbi:hypothetical protein BASA81_004802 [Batrachochytrium salamandrivorans]|nr:hypothetical protein BASA81_004802 [Batrachochytrium salamandrivorans]